MTNWKNLNKSIIWIYHVYLSIILLMDIRVVSTGAIGNSAAVSTL